jgi:hypothetical protein
MRQPSSLQEAFFRFDQRIDRFKQCVARWLNTKVVAIPLRGLRFIFLCYTVISLMVFSFILFDGDEIFSGLTPQQTPVPPAIHTTIDSLDKLLHLQK